MKNSEGDNETSVIQKNLINDLEYWLNVKRQAKLNGIKHLEEAAKEVIMITSLLQGIYFAAISFSDLKKVGDLSNYWFILFIILSIFAFSSWISSLYFATRVFIPEFYDAPSECPVSSEQVIQISNAFDASLKYKNKHLRKSFNLLWISFIPLAANFLIYLTMLPAPSKSIILFQFN